MSAKLCYDVNIRSINAILLLRRSIPAVAFLNNIYFNSKRSAHSTIDSKDFYQVNKKIPKAFWDPQGTFTALYRLNNIRVPYIRDSLVDVAPGEKFSNCLKGKKILDVGCGGGFLSEALAMLGAEVTGIDPSEAGIEHATQHRSKNKRLANNLPAYIWTTIEEHSKKYPESYDVVVASEVIDHVANQELFVESCVRAAKPGGKLFFTTINRTRIAQFFIIFVFEDILKIIPKGVHEFDKFIKPSELQYMMEMNDCFVESTKGYVYYPLAKYWEWTKHTKCFFAIEAVKSK
ncbi:ubiquinone biosynthesis O-methyltransferase, mitochondrial-like [Maniola hyperantus]|uniref:ubiquinone biosynthesis O-methyltransferase, mitochondrial-like n=1 Tax=Aphantopus hyperantus TaxID=2795564 RepID=UPI001568A783|nr:ubiquinone biosynthesis O-methyltransferase, mitochondrial-like [Maniola hyperantus]